MSTIVQFNYLGFEFLLAFILKPSLYLPEFQIQAKLSQKIPFNTNHMGKVMFQGKSDNMLVVIFEDVRVGRK